MRRPGETVKLRCNYTDSPIEVGDVLQTKRGRRYLVQSIDGKTLTCLILKPHEKLAADTRVGWWKWGPR